MVAYLGTGVFLTQARNVVLLGPPGTNKTLLAIWLGIKAAQSGHRVSFATAVDWVTSLKAAHTGGKLPAELARRRQIGLILVDEVGYIPFEQDAEFVACYPIPLMALLLRRRRSKPLDQGPRMRLAHTGDGPDRGTVGHSSSSRSLRRNRQFARQRRLRSNHSLHAARTSPTAAPDGP